MGMSGITATGTLPLPKWLLFLRIAIILLSLGVLIASAYNISHYVYNPSPPAFLVFCVIATWFILGTMLVFEFFFVQFYTRIVFIVLLSVDAIFWLSAWAWAANFARRVDGLVGLAAQRGEYDDFHASLAAAAALGAIVWVMIVVFVGFFVRACLRDDGSCMHNAAVQPKQGGMSAYPQPQQQQQFA